MDMIIGLISGAAAGGGSGNGSQDAAKQAIAQPNMWTQIAQMNQQMPNMARQNSMMAQQQNAAQPVDWTRLVGF